MNHTRQKIRGIFFILFFVSQSCLAAVKEVIGKSAFDNHARENHLVVAYFFAPNCRDCIKFSPTFESSSQLPGISFITIDVSNSNNQELTRGYTILTTPIIYFLQDGKVIKKLTHLPHKAFQFQLSVLSIFGLNRCVSFNDEE